MRFGICSIQAQRYNAEMNQCPLCNSYVLVTPEKPCGLCNLSLIEIADDKMVAVIPGWFLLESDKPRLAKSAVSRLPRIADNVILDLSETRQLSSAGIEVLLALNTVVKDSGLNLVLANVRPDVTEVFRVSRLSRVFRTVDSVKEGLETF